MPWWTAPPAIVAEALAAVPDPLLTALRPGPPAPGVAVAAALARSLLPPEDSDPPPRWLLPEQRRSFRRVLASVRRYRGVMLADPVGSGKTYVALAAAQALNPGGRVACLVPAALLPQWEAAATRSGVGASLESHEQVSRGVLPESTRGPVIIDESHHFRNRHTKRYRHLAAWLVGRPALLVTATPVVNRLSDLGHQLHLAVRDSALAIDGIASLRGLLASGCPDPALGQLIVEGEAVEGARPRRVSKLSTPPLAECEQAKHLVEMLRPLCLSRHRTIARLVRGVLLRAAASSPAALAGVLRRYRRLLLNARDAGQAGRGMDRAELRRFTAELGDQLVWWELWSTNEAPSEIELSDLPVLDDLIVTATAAQGTDAKLRRLRQLLDDGKPTLVFTACRDTVRYLREALDGFHLAWCIGDRAGIGRSALPRRAVLAWFRDSAVNESGPRHLVVTDVAAEGLDLQCAARVVHYDLPWTPMRLEQREGRAVRLGSRHAEVEVVRFAPPPVLDRALNLEATLARKARLPAAAGLGAEGQHVWRWRAEVAAQFGSCVAVAGVAAVRTSERGLLAGFAFHRSEDPTVRLGAAVGWLDLEGTWTESSEIVTRWLARAAAQAETLPVNRERLRHGLGLLAPLIRERLVAIGGRRWISPDPASSGRQVAARLHEFIREAARRRQPARLLRFERALRFVAGGHTAGEEMLIDRLADASEAEIEAGLASCQPTQTEGDEIEGRLTGLILFGEDAAASST